MADPYFNPGNPFDTGRPGEENREVLQRYIDAGRQDELRRMGWDPNAPVHWHDNPASGMNGQSGGGGGGSSLTMNPYYMQAQTAAQAADAADLSGTKGAIQQLLIAFGLVPEGFQDKLGVIDETVKSLIQKNTESGISQYARLQEAKNDVLRGTVAQGAATGSRRSGAQGWRLRRNQLGADRNFSDTLQALLGAIGQHESGYASRAYGRQMSLAQLLASLSASWRPPSSGPRTPPAGPTGPPTVTPQMPANSNFNHASNWTEIPSGRGGRWILD